MGGFEWSQNTSGGWCRSCCGFGFCLGLDRLFFAFEIAESAFPFFDFVVLSAHKSLYIGSLFRLCVSTMVIRMKRFNIYLVLATLLICVGGCETDKNDKPLATFRVHLEVSRDATSASMAVPVYRAKPVLVTVNRDSFLTEADVEGAKVVEALGGFAMQIQLNQHGTWLLENYSASNTGRHIAIFSQWQGKLKDGRWLAAPLMGQRISDGMLLFTADVSREEADEIVLGLNNMAVEVKKRNKM